MDEQWSFVGSKKNQRWLFYAWEPRFKKCKWKPSLRSGTCGLRPGLKCITLGLSGWWVGRWVSSGGGCGVPGRLVGVGVLDDTVT